MLTHNLAKSDDSVDIAKISNLLSESLPGDKKLLQNRFRALMTANSSQNIYTISDDNNDIASVLIYFENTFYYESKQLSIIYLSHLATAENYRGSGVTRRIMNFVKLNLCEKYDLVYGYPRRAIRGFWSKLDFCELTNTGVKLFKIPKNQLLVNHNCIWADANESDIAEIAKLFSKTKDGRLIRIVRDENRWKHIFLCQKAFQFRLLVCKSIDGELIAYCVIQNESVTEFCTAEMIPNTLINTNLASYIDGENLSILNRGIIFNYDKLFLGWLQSFSVSEIDPWDLVLFSKYKELLNSIIDFELSRNFQSDNQLPQALLGSNFLTLDSY